MNPNPLLVAVLPWAIAAIGLALLYAGVAGLTAMLDSRRKAADLRTYREADFWRTAHAKPEPRTRD